MKNIHKNKSRTRLYDAINGTKSVVGAAGRSAVGSIQFADQPAAGETVTIGGIWFEFQAGATEAPGTSAGTEADPHLVQTITDLATAGAALASAILAETATTGAWGYLHPIDATGVDFTTDTLTLTFWPGAWGNNVTLAGSAGDETIVQPVTASLGREAPTISLNHKATDISTVGSTQNAEYYILHDGEFVGQEVSVVVSAIDASDTPSILGHFFTSSGVQAQLSAAQDTLKLVWTGTSWKELTVTDSDAAYSASA
jgi:hypothetical protein